jgi:hypothetical protein
MWGDFIPTTVYQNVLPARFWENRRRFTISPSNDHLLQTRSV